MTNNNLDIVSNLNNLLAYNVRNSISGELQLKKIYRNGSTGQAQQNSKSSLISILNLCSAHRKNGKIH